MTTAAAAAQTVDPAIESMPVKLDFRMVPLGDIKPSALNPRKRIPQASLLELAESMGGGKGIIEPIVGRWVGGGDSEHLEIIAGERRWRAAIIARLSKVPVIIRDLTDAQVLELMVIENDQRENMHPLEEGEGYRRLLGLVGGGFSVDMLCKRIGRRPQYVRDRIRLAADLIEPAAALMLRDLIPLEQGIRLSRLKPEHQTAAITIDPKNPHDCPLFVFQADGLLTDAADEALEEQRKSDPYAGMVCKPVGEFQEWIDRTVRFQPQAAVSQELFPQTVERYEQVATFLPITREFRVPPEVKGDDTERILTSASWKRADGAERSKRCKAAVGAYVAFGPGRGESFDVCVDKGCKVHWAAEARQKAKLASGGKQAEKIRAKQEADRKRREDQDRRERAQMELWRGVAPKVIEACAEKVPAASLKALVAIGVVNRSSVREALKMLGKRGAPMVVRTADHALWVLATAALIDGGRNSYRAAKELAPMAKLLGVNIAPIIRAEKDRLTAVAKKAAKGDAAE